MARRRKGVKPRQATVKHPRKPRSRLLKDGTVKESIIQAEILAWLKTTGLMAWRANSGSLFLHGRHINLGPLGCADISVVVPPCGRFVGLEVKSAKGRIRKEQITYAAGLTACGGLYFIVRSVQEAKDAIAQALGESIEDKHHVT